jgi:hypothetical protein
MSDRKERPGGKRTSRPFDVAGTDARTRSVIVRHGDRLEFEPEFLDRLQRNIKSVSKFAEPFALYWIKATDDSGDLNLSLAALCRQEDILCHNRSGDFVAILPGTDDAGVRGFERRLEDSLGVERLRANGTKRGYSIFKPGDPIDGFAQRVLESAISS